MCSMYMKHGMSMNGGPKYCCYCGEELEKCRCSDQPVSISIQVPRGYSHPKIQVYPERCHKCGCEPCSCHYQRERCHKCGCEPCSCHYQRERCHKCGCEPCSC